MNLVACPHNPSSAAPQLLLVINRILLLLLCFDEFCYPLCRLLLISIVSTSTYRARLPGTSLLDVPVHCPSVPKLCVDHFATHQALPPYPQLSLEGASGRPSCMFTPSKWQPSPPLCFLAYQVQCIVYEQCVLKVCRLLLLLTPDLDMTASRARLRVTRQGAHRPPSVIRGSLSPGLRGPCVDTHTVVPCASENGNMSQSA